MAQRELSIKYKKQLIHKFLKAIEHVFENLGVYKFWPAEGAQIEAYFISLFSIEI